MNDISIHNNNDERDTQNAFAASEQHTQQNTRRQRVHTLHTADVSSLSFLDFWIFEIKRNFLKELERERERDLLKKK